MRLRTVPAALAVVAVGSVAFGCSSSSDDASGRTSSIVVSESPSNEFSDADVEFLQGMIPHHEQAIEMAEIALDPRAGASAAVLALAQRIRSGQDPEIDLMRGWLSAWGKPEMGEMPGHDMSSMDGMMTTEDIEKLSTVTGTAFDTLWLGLMIAHHEGAVKMADNARAGGKNADVRTLLDAIIAAQTAEIAEMRGLLG